MHILLTDVLVCPRCGPAFGLILLANRIEDRRVLDGRLGCANCREQYPIVNGTADLRQGGAASGETADAHAAPSHGEDSGVPSTEAIRIAALLGVTQGPAYVLLAGDAAAHATDVSAQLNDVEVIAVGSGAPATEDRSGTSMVKAEGLPLANGKMSGVAVTGAGATIRLLEAAARAVRPTGRLLVDPAPDDAEDRLKALGLRTLAREGAVLVAIRG